MINDKSSFKGKPFLTEKGAAKGKTLHHLHFCSYSKTYQ